MSEMGKNRISVVTVCYNAEKDIERTVSSVLNQKYEDYNYYIIDGKSSDRTVSIIKTLTDQSRVKTVLISEPDTGIFNAMNKAIDAVDGEWIIFMNAGDTFYDEYVLARFAENVFDADFVFGDANYSNEGGQYIVKAWDIDTIKNRMPFCHQAVFNKLSSIRKYRFNEKYKITADYDCYLRAYKSGSVFEYFPICVCTYEEGGASAQAENKLAREILNIQISNGITSVPRLRYVYLSIKGTVGRFVKKHISEDRLNKLRRKVYGR